MEIKKNFISIICLSIIVFVIALSVGYAALVSVELNIKSTMTLAGNIPTKFTNVITSSSYGNNLIYNINKIIVAVNIPAGESITYDTVLTNNSEYKYYIDDIIVKGNDKTSYLSSGYQLTDINSNLEFSLTNIDINDIIESNDNVSGSFTIRNNGQSSISINLEITFDWLEYVDSGETKVRLSDAIYNLFSKTTTFAVNSITYDADATNRLMKDRYGSTSNGQTLGNIRYYSDATNKNIKNYVYFNCPDTDNSGNKYLSDNYNYGNSCDVYRIIGIFNDNNQSAGYTTKIVSSKVLSTMAWDSSRSNNWNNASLNNYLNTTFYNGLSTTFKEMIDVAKWYQGGPTTSSNKYANNFYSDERTLVNASNKVSGNNYSENNIGLIYVSDLLYATSCSSAAASNYNSCRDANWLHSNATGTILSLSVVSNSTTNAYPIGKKPAKIQSTLVTTTGGVYPALYLKSDVGYVGGDGSSSNPYIIY